MEVERDEVQEGKERRVELRDSEGLDRVVNLEWPTHLQSGNKK